MATVISSEIILQQQTLTANTTFTVPAGYIIDGNPVFINTTGNAVTGGIKMGTTSGGTDVMSAQTVGVNALVCVTDANVAKRFFSDSANTTIYVQAVTSWNSASVNLTVKLLKVV